MKNLIITTAILTIAAIFIAAAHYLLLILGESDKSLEKEAQMKKYISLAQNICGSSFKEDSSFYRGSFKMAAYLFLLPGSLLGIIVEQVLF